MTLQVPTTRSRRTRPAEFAFFLVGAGVFALGALAYATYCVACAYPATVTAVG